MRRDGTRSNVFKPDRFRLHMRNSSASGWLGTGTGCPETVDTLFLEIFKAQLDRLWSTRYSDPKFTSHTLPSGSGIGTG